jgi:hypothetical protein
MFQNQCVAPRSQKFLCSVASLLLVLSTAIARADEVFVAGANFSDNTNVAYPNCAAVVDVTKSPYFAKGDGTTDDTDALQRALSDIMGQHKMLYFPNGTYLVSGTLNWSKKNAEGKEAWGMNFLQGQSATKTIIRLKDSTFTDPEKPGSIMWCGGFGSADWFHNYIQDMSFDVGDNNPSAIGLQFYSNNFGAVRNCRIVAGNNSGLIGLDLGHRDMNGPLLVKNCEIVGFQKGIATSRAVNSQTFENITLRDQSQFGFDNEGQAISVRSLLSVNRVPAIRTYGTFCLLDATLKGLDGANQVPAIINYNGGRLFVRDVISTGYNRAIGDVETPDWYAAVRLSNDDKPGTRGPNVGEYCSHTSTSLFGSVPGSLRLPVKETPVSEKDAPGLWAVVDRFGADPTGNQDSSAAIQRAIDSGATTVFLPGFYNLTQPIRLRGKVSRLLGTGAWIDYSSNSKPDIIIEDGASPVVTIEHIAHISGGIRINTKRPVILRSIGVRSVDCRTNGDVFFEDVTTDDLRFNPGQNVWARQLNVENEGTHLSNRGGNLWILGYKTERGGTLLNTTNNGRSEVLGGFSYTTTAGKLAPMFVTDNSSVFTFFNEVCYSGDPFETLIHETHGTETKTVKRGEGMTAPYSSGTRKAP